MRSLPSALQNLFIVFGIFGGLLLCGADPADKSPDNLAFGRPYTNRFLPNYTHCTDPGDVTQLTDGVRTQGYFWTQKTTVGWTRIPFVEFTIDLGSDKPIRGVSLNSAAGTAGVRWPNSIRILLSTDGTRFHFVGDLIKMSGGKSAAPTGYAIQRFVTEALETHGRYVKFVIEADGTMVFADEVEVLRGEDGWLKNPLPGEGVVFGPIYFEDPFNSSLKGRVGQDLETVRQELDESKLAEGARGHFASEITKLDEEIRKAPPTAPAGFVGIYPFNDLHRRVYALLGAIRAAGGLPPLIAWSANPLDPLAPSELPKNQEAPVVDVAAMQNENRAGALNFTNNTGKERTLRFTLEDLPGGSNPNYVTVREVLWTDTSARETVGSALPALRAKDGAYEIKLPAGMTRQVWFSVTPPTGIPPGVHKGRVVVQSGDEALAAIPFDLRVFGVKFPAHPRLHITGWDYTDGSLYGNTLQNKKPLVKLLRDRHVDSPWATKGSMTYGRYDASGKLVEAPSTASFDAWVALWPDARNYHVFVYVAAEIDGTPMDKPLFAKKVASWIRFWVAHAATLGISADRPVLCLVDESKNAADDALILGWSKALRKAEPAVRLFDTGTRPPERNTAEVIAAVDILCPHRPELVNGSGDVSFYLEQRKSGKTLYLYSCNGPGRTSDPYSYYRLQAWDAFDLGAEGSGFWSFTDTGKADPWNEFLSANTVWTPLFLEKDDAITDKQMEAISECVGDFEYLSLLREAVEKMRRTDDPALPATEKLFQGAVQQVLSAPGAHVFSWDAPEHRSIADTVRR